MKIKKLIAAALLPFGLSMVNANASTDNFEDQYYKEAATFLSTIAQHQDAIWPGFDVTKTPIILSFPKTHTLYAYYFKPTSPNWQPLDNGVFILNKKVEDVTYKFKRPGYAYFDNQKVYVFPVEERYISTQAKYTRLNNRFLIGMRFASYFTFETPFGAQLQTSFFAQSEPVNDALNDKKNTALTYLEVLALQEKDTVEALKDYAAIENIRVQSLSQSAKNYAKTNSFINELQSYIAWKAFNPDQADLSKVIKHAPTLVDNTNPNSMSETLTDEAEGFFGPVIGAALDKIVPGWKKTVETSGMTFAQIIEQHYPMNEEEIKKRYSQVSAHYNFDQMNEMVSKVMDPYLADLAKKKNEYEQSPGTEITLTGVPTSFSRTGITNTYTIDSQKTLVDMHKTQDATNEEVNFTFKNGSYTLTFSGINYYMGVSQGIGYKRYNDIQFKMLSTDRITACLLGAESDPCEDSNIDEFITLLKEGASKGPLYSISIYHLPTSSDDGHEFMYFSGCSTVTVVDGKLKIKNSGA